MILTRFVRAQLVIFAILAVIGMVAMAVQYMKLPTLAGVGTMKVTLELPTSGGLYRFGNVTYRGVQIGKVTSVDLTDDGVKATLAINGGHKIPADLEAEVRSVSAVGEQYVDLRPRTDAAPYLHEGSVIDVRAATVPQPVGPMLDKLDSLVTSIPKDKLHNMLGEMFAGLNGAGYDLQSLLDSASKVAADADKTGDTTRALLEGALPLVDSQDQSADAIRIWARSLAGVTGQLAADDGEVRSLLDKGPGAIRESTKLLDSVKLTLPVLLSNLTSVAQLGVTYHAGLEQILVLLPPEISIVEAVQPTKNAQGLGLGDFRVSGVSDPPACTVGFLPPSQWRDPSDTSTIDTPDNLYCKLPQDSPVAVRGVRNFPCATHPGKRAPTAEMCNSDENFEPLSKDQPVVGPYPRDPGLEAQGIPPDTRPLPSPAEPAPPPPQQPPVPRLPQLPQLPQIPLPRIPGLPAPAAAPASDTGKSTPSVAFAHYDPHTGKYLAPDGTMYRQQDLATTKPAGWKDLVLH